MPLVPAEVGAVLLGAVADRYERVCPDCSLVQFMQSGATYLFDLASAVGAGQEDRTVAAWTVTPATVNKRDVSYQRGFPLAADPGGPLVDRGHLIPNLSGGEFGPNIFRQDRPLNRGWSQEGRRFRHWNGRRPFLAPSISGTCSTRMTPPTRWRLRSEYSEAAHCT